MYARSSLANKSSNHSATTIKSNVSYVEFSSKSISFAISEGPSKIDI